MADTTQGNPVMVTRFSQANFGGYTPFETQSITRSENTDAYSAGDVITGASDAAFVFTKASKTGGWIVSAKLNTADTGAIGDFTLHFMSAKPATFVDGGAFTLTSLEYANSYYGSVTLTVGTTGTLIATAIDTSLRIPYSSDGNIYAILVTDDGITPVSASVWYVTLGFENNIPEAFPTAR